MAAFFVFYGVSVAAIGLRNERRPKRTCGVDEDDLSDRARMRRARVRRGGVEGVSFLRLGLANAAFAWFVAAGAAWETSLSELYALNTAFAAAAAYGLVSFAPPANGPAAVFAVTLTALLMTSIFIRRSVREPSEAELTRALHAV